MYSQPDPLPAPLSSEQWAAHFRANDGNLLALPWDGGAAITPAERAAIAASVQEFQLGESSEGRNLISAARRYAASSGDAAYVDALLLFIAEEHRHARDLGRFLDLAGVPRAGHARPDTVFRWSWTGRATREAPPASPRNTSNPFARLHRPRVAFRRDRWA